MKNQAFTLVELIVVVTILAILATIGFVSYSGYLTGVRDTNRIASLTSISDGLELYRTKNDLPDPDNALDIQIETTIIGHQGYVGSNVLQTIEYSKAGKDPKDDTYYSYYLTDDKKHYQLMAFLEETDNLESSVIGQSNAAISYTSRHPKVYGKKLGILTDLNNTPVQELTTGTLTFTGGTTTSYITRFADSEILTASGNTLKNMATNASCKRIKELKGGSKDGVYSINPSGTAPFDVYCDMTSDGGGWTYATMLADATTINLFETGNTNKITSLTQNISTKGNLSNIWQDNMDRDVLVVCKTNHTELKAYEYPTIFYGYKFSDISNLTDDVKINTPFSSTQLLGRYKNKKFTVNTAYATSASEVDSFYPKVAGGNNIMYIHTQLGVNSGGEPGFAGYASSNTFQDLTVNNYCMTAIR